MMGDILSRGTCPEGDKRDTPIGGVSRLSLYPQAGLVPVPSDCRSANRPIGWTHAKRQTYRVNSADLRASVRTALRARPSFKASAHLFAGRRQVEHLIQHQEPKAALFPPLLTYAPKRCISGNATGDRHAEI
jgi:hypothetical protein